MSQNLSSLFGTIHKLGSYHSYRRQDGSINPNFDNFSRMVLDLKDPSCAGHKNAVIYFGNLLKSWVAQTLLGVPTLAVAIVPSSTFGKKSLGLEAMLPHILQPPVVQYNPNYLVRKHSVTSAHLGGVRNMQIHVDSIEVRASIDPNVPVLLLDDVCTTGASLRACDKLLKNAGARNVIMAAVGGTV